MNKIKKLLCMFIYKVAPVKSNRFVFTSFEGHYSDNPKYISIKLHEINKEAQIIWLVKPEYIRSVPDYAKSVNIDSVKAYWYRGTATAQIDNVYGFRAYFKTVDNIKENIKMRIITYLLNKKRQPIFATMHGTPLKKIGRDQIGNTVLDCICPNSYLLVGDRLTADVLKGVTFNKIPIIIVGSPRNDALFNYNPNLKFLLGLPSDKKIVLYAPTFRNDGKDVEGKNVLRSGINQLSEIDFDLFFKKLSSKFGGEWVMILRFHYHVADLVDWESLEKKYPGKFINGNQNDDMSDYLSCADILITDASSSMFDFALTKKPCFLYFPDIENYRDKERGFYMEIEELPFPISVSFLDLLQSMDAFDKSNYEKRVEILLKKIGSENDGNASERVVNYILNSHKLKK